jgi:RNA polymerase sigma-70 factor (ECF subfamily)
VAMSDNSLHTMDLRLLVERGRKGDREAHDLLLRRASERLERMAHAMLSRFPSVHRHVETNDVLQNAMMRLLRALEKVEPASTREFFGLAALQIRRELLDLARSFKERMPLLKQDLRTSGQPTAGTFDVVDEAAAEADLDFWCAFHEAVERLPAREREVFSLSFYQGWTQPQIAELLQVTERQVRRRWNAAVVALNEHMGGTLPALPVADGDAAERLRTGQ